MRRLRKLTPPDIEDCTWTVSDDLDMDEWIPDPRSSWFMIRKDPTKR